METKAGINNLRNLAGKSFRTRKGLLISIVFFMFLMWNASRKQCVQSVDMSTEIKTPISIIADYDLNLEATYLSAVLSTECFPHDIDCAMMVYNVIKWRAELSATDLITVVQIPYQFSGLWVKTSPEKLVRLMIEWNQISADLLTGELDVSSFPRATHYARKEVIFKTGFGKEAVSSGCSFFQFGDGHIMIGDTASGDYLRFKTN